MRDKGKGYLDVIHLLYKLNTNETIISYNSNRWKREEVKKMYKWRQIMVNKPLANLTEGEKGKITQIRGSVMTQRNLLDKGFAVGREIYIEKVDKTPQDLAITVKAGDKISTLNEAVASNIRVKVPSFIEDRQIPTPDISYVILQHHYC
jgi:Fe2+ transport system protein FeoA